MTLEKLPILADDGLYCPEVGAWSETKYRLIQNYAAMFSTAMKEKWDCRVYLDLFSGGGRARVKGTKRIIAGSPLLALGVSHPFDRYVFCEEDSRLVRVLRERVERDHPQIEVRIVQGDCNDRIGDIMDAIPRARKDYKVLTLCVVDPYAISNLRFQTVSTIAERFVDFLVLIPSFMDANRNQDLLLDSHHPLLDAFLGDDGWRERWRARERSAGGIAFGTFVVQEFGRAMDRHGYREHRAGAEERVQDRGRTLYHLAFYSRHALGRSFWDKARQSSMDQGKFEF